MIIRKKQKVSIHHLSKEEDKKLHPSSLRIGDLVGTVIDKFCQVSIDIIIPDTLNLQSVYEGPIGDAPENMPECAFSPDRDCRGL